MLPADINNESLAAAFMELDKMYDNKSKLLFQTGPAYAYAAEHVRPETKPMFTALSMDSLKTIDALIVAGRDMPFELNNTTLAAEQ